MLWIIISILSAVVVAVIGYILFFSKGSEPTVTMKPEVNPVKTLAPTLMSTTKPPTITQLSTNLSIPVPIVTNFSAPTGEYGSNCVPQNSSCNCRMHWRVLYQVTVNGVKSISPPSEIFGTSDNCNYYWNPTLYFTITNPPINISSDIKLILLTCKDGEKKWYYSKIGPITITGNNNIKFSGETATFGSEYGIMENIFNTSNQGPTCDRNDTSKCIFKDYRRDGGTCVAPPTGQDSYSASALASYDQDTFRSWLNTLWNRNVGSDPNKNERSNVNEYRSRCGN